MERKFTMISKQSSKENLRFKTLCAPPSNFVSAFEERKWLKGHGKYERINFSDEALRKLRKYFDSLDSEGKGSLGVEEL